MLGVGSWVLGVAFRVHSGFWVRDLGFRVVNTRFGVQGLGIRVEG